MNIFQKEMLRINADAVYFVGFNFIREIAVFLKTIMKDIVIIGYLTRE